MSTKANDLIKKEINSTLKNMEEIKSINDLVKSKIDERKIDLINEVEDQKNKELKKMEEESSERLDTISKIANAINSNNLDQALKLLKKASI